MSCAAVSSEVLSCMATWTWLQIDPLVSAFEQPRLLLGCGRTPGGGASRRPRRAVLDHHVADDGHRTAYGAEVVGSRAVRADDRQLFSENADLHRLLGDDDRDRFGARRRHRLDAGRSAPAGDSID